MKKTKAISYDGHIYTVTTITAIDARLSEFSEADGKALPQKEFNLKIVGQSLVAGGHADGQEFANDLPYFGEYQEFLSAAFEVNGIGVNKTKGKDEAVASPAAE